MAGLTRDQTVMREDHWQALELASATRKSLTLVSAEDDQVAGNGLVIFDS